MKNNDIVNLTRKHLLFKQFVSWSCNNCTTAPLSGYINNRIYQELIEEADYHCDTSNERVYLDIGASPVDI